MKGSERVRYVLEAHGQTNFLAEFHGIFARVSGGARKVSGGPKGGHLKIDR